MAAAKKFDTSKLTLGPKKDIKKDELIEPAGEIIETVVEHIHNPKPDPVLDNHKAEKPLEEPTKRTTLDIPQSLHKQIKRRLLDKELTIKEYFLNLVKKDLGLQ